MSAKKQTSALQLAQKVPDQSNESQLPVSKNVFASLLRISWFFWDFLLFSHAS